MVVRLAIAIAALIFATPSMAQTMNPDTARHFVVGKLFSYNCFDGTRGIGRIFGDGSVAGTMQSNASAPIKFVHLPPGTLKVKGAAVCASVRGMLFEPCFNLNKTSNHSFRGSISGLSFAYCDFDQRRTRAMHTAFRRKTKQPTQQEASASGE